MGAFEKSLQKFGKKAIKNHVEVKRKAAFDLFASVVLSTPVDKGTLRNNWFAQIGSGSNETTEDVDKSGAGTTSRIDTVLAGTLADADSFLTNNLPYAARIEFDGYSWRKPEGMVRINTIRWDRIVARIARKVARD